MKNLSPQWRSILWVVIPIYLLANIYLIIVDDIGNVLLRLAYTLYILLLGWLTLRVTNPQPAAEEEAPSNKSMLWVQIGILVVVILITALNSSSIPVWSAMTAWAYNLGETYLPAEWFGGPGNSVANPLQYFIIPLVILLLMGARPAELGLGKGHKVWQASLVWLALPLVIWAGLLATGNLSAQTLARRIIGNFFQNGFFEEFLFRGALQTRLRKVMSSPWALTVQAFLFGLWHLRANTNMMDGNLLAGLAFCIVSQTVSGLVFGYVFERTRNLIAPTVAHVAMNTLGQSFG